MSEYISYTSTERYAIPHRAYPTGELIDGHRSWQIEYQQNPRDRYWGPRGVFEERDGKFHWAGKEFDSVYAVLRYRAANP